MKFRRQHPIGRFVVDLYCPDFRLVVEVDGGVHDQRIEYDAIRTGALEAEGYRVMRITNEEVLRDVEGVLSRIEALTP